jgi:hypothetical protein
MVGQEGDLPVDEFAPKTVLEKKVKQQLLSFRRRFCRERGGILVYGHRVDTISIKPGHGCACCVTRLVRAREEDDNESLGLALTRRARAVLTLI